MNDHATTSASPTRWQRVCRSLLLRSLAGIEGGRLSLEDGDERHLLGQGKEVRVRVHDGSFYSAALLEQSSGVGRAYMEGWWTCDDPVGFVRLLARNEKAIRRWTAPTRIPLAPWHRFLLWRRRNTEAQARRNIAAHYDLGNDFFAAFLDRTMSYSCAVFENPDDELATAQVNKLERICRKLDLHPTDHVLEIGTGWGGFALHAADRYGCQVTTTTISAEQATMARDRIRAAGLADRVTVLEEDYRRLRGTYQKLVSIEMIEAVGVRYFPAFFRACSDLLTPEGAMLLQAIVVDDRHFDHDAKHEDFIKRWIFPGGVLPSVGEIAKRVALDTDLRIAHIEDLTGHYAETIHRWHGNLKAAWNRLKAAGHDEAFLRAWEFYFHYCRGGFLERRVGLVQFLLVKPRCRDLAILRPVAAPWPGNEIRSEVCHG